MAFGKNSKRTELVNSDIIRQFYKNNNKCDHIYNDMIIIHMKNYYGKFCNQKNHSDNNDFQLQ